MNLQAQQLLACLAAAHVVVDFCLQSDSDVRNKRRLAVLLKHALGVAVLSYVLCGAWRVWLIPIGVFVAHGVVDAIKVRIPQQNATTFLLDQFAHAASIVVIAVLVAQRNPSLWGVSVFGENYLKLMVLLAGAIATVMAGGVFVSLMTNSLREEIETHTSTRGLMHGGRLIGRLERSLIFLLILSGQAAGIGFLIAAKSVFRFGESQAHS